MQVQAFAKAVQEGGVALYEAKRKTLPQEIYAGKYL